MYLSTHLDLKMPAGLDRDAIGSAAEQLAPLFASEAARDRIGLAVASPNAGNSTAVRFWAEARRTGLGLASPELFPWCLANAACGALARRFDVRGPNFTYLGSSDALLAAIESARVQFTQHSIETAVVVVLEFAEPELDTGRLFAFRLDLRPTARAIRVERTTPQPAALHSQTTMDAFAGTLRQLVDGTLMDGTVTDGTRTFLLRPLTTARGGRQRFPRRLGTRLRRPSSSR